MPRKIGSLNDKIEVKEFVDTYDEYSSKIIEKINLMNQYKDDYNMLRVSEMELEKQRTLKNSSLFGVSIKSSGKNIVGGAIQSIASKITPTNLKDAFNNIGFESLITYGRAVGPLEELPIMDYIQDTSGIRASSVLSNTQTRAEHKFLSKVYQQRSTTNKDGTTVKNRYPINEIGGAGVDLPETSIDNNLYLTNNSGTNSRLRSQANSKLRINTWNPVDGEYPRLDELVKNLDNGGKFDFFIYNTANFTMLSLPAYISDVSENLSVNWESLSLINRSEDLYIYNRASREYSISLKLFYTNNGDDLDDDSYGPYIFVGSGPNKVEVGTISKTKMWKSIEFLHTLTRPKYGSDGTFISAPYCKLKVGDLFDHTVIVDSVSISYSDLIWDINISEGKNTDGIKPMIANITLNGKILHGGSPSVDSKFYPKNRKVGT